MARFETERVRLIHWHPAEAEAAVARLEGAGFTVEYEAPSQATLKAIRGNPPAALVVDLSRSPSQGRDVAAWVRSQASTRGIPLVFVGGAPEKIGAIRRLIPDAPFVDWPGVGPAVRRAIAAPPADPVTTTSIMAGYSGTPLPKKLGIKDGMRVVTVGAPPDFVATLGTLPPGARLEENARASSDLIIWFVTSVRELERRVASMAKRVTGGLWIAWPKQASGVPTDVREQAVRDAGLAHGLVDYKIAAIDAVWSGLKFARRKPAKPVKQAARRLKQR